MDSLNNCYESVSSGPALVRRAGTLLAFVLCLDGSWGWAILDDYGVLQAAARRFSLTADQAVEEADRKLRELAIRPVG